ncbi:hypothetical protein [Microcoleus anatoxicus]|uniref:Uncharacterized protein n=1 Tax=Microcoleus anatoxicus PTRS2 TaxID=2705321 RepID=A0ABU8YXR7_9CYAN
MVAKSLPSTPMQQTLMSVTEAFKSFKELRDLYLKGQLHFKPKPPGYLKGSKKFQPLQCYSSFLCLLRTMINLSLISLCVLCVLCG